MNIIKWILSLFKKPKKFVPILPVNVMGSSWVYTPVINNTTANWLPYISTPFESQNLGSWDELNCVCQSGINVIEAILNYYYKNNLLPIQLSDFIKNNGYLNEQGFIKLSTRFQAKMAGTTHQGVGMDAFWQSVNRDGILPYTAHPDPVNKSFNWDEYYQAVPPEVIKAGKLAADIFQFSWQVFKNNEWDAPIIADLKSALTNSPIHFASMICASDSAGIERWCGAKYYQHARAVYGVDDYINVLDSEMPAIKKLELKFPLACCIKAQLKIS